MSRSRRSGWLCIELILCLCIIGAFPVTPIFVQSTSSSTNFSYPVFRSVDDFFTFGEIQHNTEAQSFTVNPIPHGLLTTSSVCIKLLYKDKVRMKNSESSAMASFSTSFTFSVTKSHPDQFANRTGWLGHSYGLAFNLISENISTVLFGHAPDYRGKENMKYLGVEFDTYFNPDDEDPSNNHIGININNPKSVQTYNLCLGERTSCSFPWTNQAYTAWIDYNGSTQSLEVWFANGSLTDGAIKPAGSGVMKVLKLDPNVSFLDEFMYVGFSVNIGPSLDIHDIKSWNFASHLEESLAVATSFPSRHFAERNAILVIGTAVSVAAISLLGCCWRRQLHVGKSEAGLDYDQLFNGLRRFTFKELKKATNNFSEGALLGKGGSGSVYKGTLKPSGMVVAVKRLKQNSEHVQRQFLAELSSISQIRHRNLVHLQGWCHEDDHFVLVFSYMSNGSLDEWLFPNYRRYPRDPKYKVFALLPWELRVSILAGVAAAVEYLHEEWVQCVLHRDIKSSNVMLDADFNPHLGDFGLARLMDHTKLEKTTMMAGTFGYMAPEVHYTGKATKESDVYSFGVLMLEVLCGRKPVDLQVEDPDEDFMLVQNVWRAQEGGSILGAVDKGLLNLHLHQLNKPPRSSTASSNQVSQLNYSPLNELPSNISFPAATDTEDMTFNVKDKIVPLLQLGLQCCLLDPESRPAMRVVKQVILQVQGSTGEDTMTMLSSMPPLPSTMPVYEFALQMPRAPMKATRAPFDDREASYVQRSNTTSVLRRQRFSSEPL